MQATWEDVPHLSEEAKKQMLDAMQPHMRDARSKGVPTMGAGVIYPVPESVVVCDPFDLPDFWPRAYGMDVGWNRTAAVWGAWDRHSDTVYIYAEHYMGQAAPAVHASAISARGSWIWGAIDPASAGSSQKDGQSLRQEYVKLGLNLMDADNTVEAGIHAVYQRMVSGRLKIFSSCRNLISELRIYRRNDDGKIIKENDHAMDALRYLIMTGLKMGKTAPSLDDEDATYHTSTRNRSTGY